MDGNAWNSNNQGDVPNFCPPQMPGSYDPGFGGGLQQTPNFGGQVPGFGPPPGVPAGQFDPGFAGAGSQIDSGFGGAGGQFGQPGGQFDPGFGGAGQGYVPPGMPNPDMPSFQPNPGFPNQGTPY